MPWSLYPTDGTPFTYWIRDKVIKLSSLPNIHSLKMEWLKCIYIYSIALDRALASLTGFMIVRYIRCGGYQPHDQPDSSHLIWPPGTSVSKASRHHLVAEQVKHGWEIAAEILPTSTYRARRVLLHAANLRYGTDGFTSSPKEGVLRILSPLNSIDLGRV
jgi:hypothetical protein